MLGQPGHYEELFFDKNVEGAIHLVSPENDKEEVFFPSQDTISTDFILEKHLEKKNEFTEERYNKEKCRFDSSMNFDENEEDINEIIEEDIEEDIHIS